MLDSRCRYGHRLLTNILIPLVVISLALSSVSVFAYGYTSPQEGLEQCYKLCQSNNQCPCRQEGLYHAGCPHHDKVQQEHYGCICQHVATEILDSKG